MRTFFIVFTVGVLLSLSSCRNSSDSSGELKGLVLRGPSSIAFADLIANPPVLDGKKMDITIYNTPDMLQACLIRGEFDVAILPMLQAVNLYNKGVSFKLLGCPIWGTLYIIGRYPELPASSSDVTLNVFGPSSSPDIHARFFLDKHQLNYNIDYTFQTPYDIMQGLIIKKIDMAVLSEPFLTMALRKDTSLHVLANLNAPINDEIGFPQSAVIYKDNLSHLEDSLIALVTRSCNFVNEHPDETIHILETHDFFRHGVLKPESIERCSINFVPARQAEQTILDYLSLILKYDPRAIGDMLPDSAFFN